MQIISSIRISYSSAAGFTTQAICTIQRQPINRQQLPSHDAKGYIEQIY